MKKSNKEAIIFWTTVGVIAIIMISATVWSLCNLDKW